MNIHLQPPDQSRLRTDAETRRPSSWR